MKAFLLSAVLLLFLNNCKHDNVKHDNVAPNEYIEIKHTGIQNKPINPLIISTKKVYLKVDRSDLVLLDTKMPLTPGLKEAYLNMHYTFIITDMMTYQTITDFVDENQDLFTNGSNNNYGGYEDYSIAINGKEYEIFYKFKRIFFLKLRLKLQKNNGDKALIRQLEYY